MVLSFEAVSFSVLLFDSVEFCGIFVRALFNFCELEWAVSNPASSANKRGITPRLGVAGDQRATRNINIMRNSILCVLCVSVVKINFLNRG